MATLNKVFLIGNLTRDPELRYTPQGTAVARLGLAVNRTFTGADKQKREEVCFVDIDAWGRTAEICNEYLRKGRQVFVDGRLTYHTWQGQDGKKQSRIRVTAENVQFLGAPRAAEEPAAMSDTGGGAAVEPPAESEAEGESSVPF